MHLKLVLVAIGVGGAEAFRFPVPTRLAPESHLI
jgi:hypothetical protein